MATDPVTRTSPASAADRRTSGAPPVAIVVLSLALCLVGLGISAYLTYEHYTSSTTLACSDNGTINCLKVTTSSYSKVLGVPVADLGLVFFALMGALCLPTTWRRPGLQTLRLGAAAAGMLSVLYLVWVELFQVDAICLWCTGVHVLTFLLFVTVLLAGLSDRNDARGAGGAYPADL